MTGLQSTEDGRGFSLIFSAGLLVINAPAPGLELSKVMAQNVLN